MLVPRWTTPQSSTRQISIKTQNIIVFTVEFTRILFPGGEKPRGTSNTARFILLDARTAVEVTESTGTIRGIHFELTARMSSSLDCTPKLAKVRCGEGGQSIETLAKRILALYIWESRFSA
jgi:hypothetical protein